MDEAERKSIIDAVRRLSTPAFKGFDAACTTIIPAIFAIPDARAQAVATALATVCEFRKALKRR